MLKKILIISAFFLLGCDDSKDNNNSDKGNNPTTKSWRYFDREFYLPSGVSVSPEMAGAQDIVKTAMEELASSSDLGVDYFIFNYEENSLLQPVAGETTYQGRVWRSFAQIWEDNPFNDYLAANVGASTDQDLIVVKNKLNQQEYFMILRLSCFVAGETCGYPTQGQAKAMVWRSFGYLIGLRYGDNAASTVMSPGFLATQESESEKRKFLAEFNGQLERIRLGLPLPNE